MGKFIISESQEGYRFMFQNAKGEILGMGQFFPNQSKCHEAIDYVIKKAASAPIDDQTASNTRYKGNPKFIIYKDNNEMYRFNLEGEGGAIIIEGAAYTSMQHCLDAIALIRYNVTGVQQH